MSNANLAKDIWVELRDLLNPIDAGEAAELLISVMLNHDISIDQIKSAFHDERDILSHFEDDDLDEDDDFDEDDDYLDLDD